MRKLSILFVTVLLMILSPLALAVRAHSIYQAEVPVASRSAQDKAKATDAGFEQVLIKVSGNSRVLEDNPSLKASLNHADALAQEYSYSSPTNADKATPYLLTIHYDAEAVNKLLKGAGVPLWTQNRPLVLVWLAFEGPNHPVDIVDSSLNDQQTLLKQIARQRGVPLILPVMDVTDLAEISVNDVVTSSVPPLQKAAERYASNAILIGHVAQGDQDFNSQWKLVLGTDQWTWDIPGKDMQEVFSGVINHVADTLAKRYAIVMTDNVQSQLTVKVIGVKEQGDLLQLMKNLQHLAPVAEVQLRTVTGDEIILDISLRGSKQSFVQAMGLAKNIEPVSDPAAEADMLVYRWTQ